ncbi:MAG: 50S ribosomal protein L18 [Clostridia bacterium]|nr:50S ribosomal protein L18 [Clostridia bacterium]
MIKRDDKNALRKKRHVRVRSRVSGTAQRPRLNVYRSTNNIYCQIIDDDTGCTLVAASSVEPVLRDEAKSLTKTRVCALIGKKIAERALEKEIKTVVFDRGGYLYTGRVAEVARAAREAGLEF